MITDITITAFIATDYREVWGEDGLEARRTDYPLIEATSAEGFRWYSTASFRTLEEAEASVRSGEAGTPVSFPDGWREADPIYGSDAWGPEAEASLACFEADAYGEPRPAWAGW